MVGSLSPHEASQPLALSNPLSHPQSQSHHGHQQHHLQSHFQQLTMEPSPPVALSASPSSYQPVGHSYSPKVEFEGGSTDLAVLGMSPAPAPSSSWPQLGMSAHQDHQLASLGPPPSLGSPPSLLDSGSPGSMTFGHNPMNCASGFAQPRPPHQPYFAWY